MLKDIRYAFRALRQSPGFALTAIISIALAIGANSAIFSLADGVLLRPLPVRNPSEVVTIRAVAPTLNSSILAGTGFTVSYPDFVDFRDRSQSFSGMFAYNLTGTGFARDPQAQPQIKMGFLVSGNFFHVLGVEPEIGRAFQLEEDQVPGRDAVIVLAHDFWEQEFGADPSAIGRHVRLNAVDFTIIGVAPESFTGIDQFIHPAFFVPLMMGPRLSPPADVLTNRAERTFSVKGRLKPGVSINSAAAEVSTLAKSLEQSYPDTNRGFGATVHTEVQARLDLTPFYGGFLALLFGLVTVVLLIACANVANLTLGRGRSRGRELAVRLAIGASRFRLVRQLMTENLLIALAGGGLGLFMAQAMVEMLSSLEIIGDTPIKLVFRLDERVLVFTLFVSIGSALLFGLVPAMQSTKTDLAPALKAGEGDPARKRHYGRNALVAAQVAGSLVLLIAAARTYLVSLEWVADDPGFRKDHMLLMRLDTEPAGLSPEQSEQFYKRLIERSGEVPGLKSAALSFFIPFTFNLRQQNVIPEGFLFAPGQQTASVLASTVDTHFFETFRIPILKGREFRPTDLSNSPRVAVVNDVFAHRYFKDDPIGKRIRLTDQNGPWVEVIGVAAASKYLALAEPPTGFLYLPLTQDAQQRLTLIGESEADPAALAAPLRELVRSIDPKVPIFGVRTMDDIYQQALRSNLQFGTIMFTSIGVMGLVLAVSGLYAVVAYQVGRRTREIGIRMALGAERLQVMKMVLTQAAAVALIGISIGLALSLASGPAMRQGRPPSHLEPWLFILMPAGLLLVTMLAAAVPARRASRIDPQQALRQE